MSPTVRWLPSASPNTRPAAASHLPVRRPARTASAQRHPSHSSPTHATGVQRIHLDDHRLAPQCGRNGPGEARNQAGQSGRDRLSSRAVRGRPLRQVDQECNGSRCGDGRERRAGPGGLPAGQPDGGSQEESGRLGSPSGGGRRQSGPRRAGLPRLHRGAPRSAPAAATPRRCTARACRLRAAPPTHGEKARTPTRELLDG